jgi:hypothetical protein
MNVAPANPRAAASGWPERQTVLLLCVAAAVHVFIFSAAFPFFNNVDEPIHLDLAIKYAQGRVPRGLEPLSAESAFYLSLYNSLAYLGTPAMFPDGKFPAPVWDQPVEKVRAEVAANVAAWREQLNYECSQPPLYYAAAGLWWRIGGWLGFEGGRLLYWLRFLNLLAVGATVWLGYHAARLIFPEQRFPRLAVPALLAFMPQTAFYSIGNDVFSPLAFGALFICVLCWLRGEAPEVRLGIVSGLAFAATLLTKMTNLPLLLVAGAAVLLRLGQWIRAGKGRAAWPTAAVMALCAGLPVAVWLAWCKYHYGDFTGAEIKTGHLGWTRKPFGEWFHHPLYTPSGLWTYLLGQLATFWQGEFWWHGRPLARPAIDVIYSIASLLLAVLAGVVALQKSARATSLQRRVLGFSLAFFVAALAFFAFLSVFYDFHNCPNPSREHPFFAAGRMMLGALIPFMLLMACGLDRASGRLGAPVKFLILGLVILLMLVTEIAIDWPAFANEFNWFHM